MTAPKAPAHLRPATRTWYRKVVADFRLEEHHLRLLQLAAEAWDRAEEAREVVAKAGPYYSDRFGAPRAHAALAVRRDAEIAFARLLRELDLDIEAPRSSPRPPSRY